LKCYNFQEKLLKVLKCYSFQEKLLKVLKCYNFQEKLLKVLKCYNFQEKLLKVLKCYNFQEKLLKVLKCYNFLGVQRRHKCSPAASFVNCVMTLHLLKVHLQTSLSIPITQKCQILSCDTLVANKRYTRIFSLGIAPAFLSGP
jgi:hypothetical protein